MGDGDYDYFSPAGGAAAAPPLIPPPPPPPPPPPVAFEYPPPDFPPPPYPPPAPELPPPPLPYGGSFDMPLQPVGGNGHRPNTGSAKTRGKKRSKKTRAGTSTTTGSGHSKRRVVKKTCRIAFFIILVLWLLCAAWTFTLLGGFAGWFDIEKTFRNSFLDKLLPK